MMSFIELVEGIRSLEATIQFLIERKLLPRNRKCVCGEKMTLHKGGNSAEAYRYRCGRPCRKEIALRKGTFFEFSKSPLKNIIFFIYFWATEECSFKKINREIKLSREPFVAWRKYMREVCGAILLLVEGKIGGEGHLVQIDESLFSRRKSHAGRILSAQWVFGGIDDNTGDCFMETVINRSRETLLEVIRRRILPGTTIISDCWAAYRELEIYDYTHRTVNHTHNFVDPITGAHTQKIENLWFLSKMRNKRECGTSRNYLESYLEEFIWRRKFKDHDLFDLVLKHISLIYSCESLEYNEDD